MGMPLRPARRPCSRWSSALIPSGRAHLLAWLCLCYQDDGAMFSPQISRRRQRIAIDGIEYWPVKVPKRRYALAARLRAVGGHALSMLAIGAGLSSHCSRRADNLAW